MSILPVIFKNLFAKAKINTSLEKNVLIKNKSLDEVEVALQRTFWNRATSSGMWQLHGGQLKDVNKSRQIIYHFLPLNSDLPILALHFNITREAQCTRLTWTFKKDQSADRSIDDLIGESNAIIEQLIALADQPAD